MIIILNGSVGVGKTSVAWDLNAQLDKSVMLDGDYLGAVHPFEIYDGKRVAYLYKTILLLIDFHQSSGYENFVINYVFETTEQLETLIALLQPYDQQILSFWLVCSEKEHKKRVRRRSNWNMEWELKRYRELNTILEESSSNGFIGIRFDTTDLSTQEAAMQIRSKADALT